MRCQVMVQTGRRPEVRGGVGALRVQRRSPVSLRALPLRAWATVPNCCRSMIACGSGRTRAGRWPGTCRRAQSARRCRTLRSCARCPPRWSTDTAPGRRQLVLGEQILQCRPAPSERPRRGVRARERQQGKAGLFLAGSSRGAVNQALIRGFPNGETRQSSWAVTHI